MVTDDQPSTSALSAAAARAAHLIVDREPVIFADHLAAPLLGERAAELISYHTLHGSHPVLVGTRTQVTVRSRYTEDRVAASGVGQYVILGAGLDSFAYRPGPAAASEPSPRAMRVFEVDHPATQAGKRRRIADAGIEAVHDVRYVPVDFEADPLVERLVAHGFDLRAPAVVSWLGVSMYLTRTAIGRTLAQAGTFAAGTEIILDYLVPESMRDDRAQTYVEMVGAAMAERGEPWLSFLAPDEMTALLREHGFTTVEHIGQRDMPALRDRTDVLRPSTLSILAHGRIGP
jgi:methyltransferase (TIGR00027 family)